MDKARILRGINHFYTKLQSLLHEKQYKACGTRVKYMFFPKKGSDTLLVSFPACAPNTAKYNYMRTLIPYKCNKLFLLDDFGANHQGCYLVEDKVERCTKNLIEMIIEKCNSQNRNGGGQSFENQRVKRIVFLGSSKGGYSALNFAFLIPGATVIIGAPQYYLGSYLDKKDTKVNLQYLIGDITEANKERLNIRLKNRIATSEIKPECIYFHYSNVEHTYKEHIKDMLADLNSAGVRVIEDVQKYPNHGDLKDFYPLFLGEKLNELLKE